MSLSEELDLAVGFRRYFRIESAADENSLREVFRLRHEVYCEDLGFEATREEGIETDEYDRNSLHCLLRTNGPAAIESVGCTRIVMTDPADRDAPLPFERTCAHTLDRALMESLAARRDRICEVSRLAVCRKFRRRKGEHAAAVSIREEDFGIADQPRFPYIPVSLYLGAIALAEAAGVDRLFVLTEPRLAAHFARLGVNIRQIGGPVSHRGVRIPSVIDLHEVIDTMRPTIRPLWSVVREEVGASLGQPASSTMIRSA